MLDVPNNRKSSKKVFAYKMGKMSKFAKHKAISSSSLGSSCLSSANDSTILSGGERIEQPAFRVLVANDEEFQLQMQTLLLEGKNCEVVEARNGFEAFSKVQKSIQSHKQEELFDLVVLDLNMPIENGYNACRMITKLYSENSIIELSLESD
mmetsp:Transcript_17115/g.26463  ORF Transcript_17115/g.26463 Transcript_17115/m.26463 type:complete len:152 (-) Transcript_17115:749-1204(-)